MLEPEVFLLLVGRVSELEGAAVRGHAQDEFRLWHAQIQQVLDREILGWERVAEGVGGRLRVEKKEGGGGGSRREVMNVKERAWRKREVMGRKGRGWGRRVEGGYG